MGRARIPLVLKLWTHTAWDDSADGCWLWTGKVARQARGLSQHPYGVMRDWPGERRTHRVAYEVAYGPIPDGMFVCHRCDNPRCNRPSHLFLGSHADNMADAKRKGRFATGRRVAVCPAGHPYDEENTYVSPRGFRHCRTCQRERDATRRALLRYVSNEPRV